MNRTELDTRIAKALAAALVRESRAEQQQPATKQPASLSDSERPEAA
jgi:hypothetical protein